MYKKLNSTTTLIHRITKQAPHEQYASPWPAVTDGLLDQAKARHLDTSPHLQRPGEPVMGPPRKQS
jgi:hypothetical protein